MKNFLNIATIIVLFLSTEAFAEEGYIRVPRWHVRPWKSVQYSNSAVVPFPISSDNVADNQEKRDEIYVYGLHDTPVNPFVQKILNLMKEKEAMAI